MAPSSEVLRFSLPSRLSAHASSSSRGYNGVLTTLLKRGPPPMHASFAKVAGATVMP